MADLDTGTHRAGIRALFGNPDSFIKGVCAAPVALDGRAMPVVSADGLAELIMHVRDRHGPRPAISATTQLGRDTPELHDSLTESLWHLPEEHAKSSEQRERLKQRVTELAAMMGRIRMLEANLGARRAEQVWLRSLPEDQFIAIANGEAATVIVRH